MRLILGLCILAVVDFGCSDRNSSNFLQEQEISVVPPRVYASSAIIDSSVLVTADLRLEGVQIFYTNDGSEPTKESINYTEPITIDKEGEYNFRAFHPNWKASETNTLKLYRKGFTPDNIDWETQPSTSYPGVGISTLINHEKASTNFRNEQWLGFNENTIADVHFEGKTFIESLTIGYLVDPNSWIFPPADVTIYLNETDSIRVHIERLEETVPVGLDDLKIPIGKELSSLKIKLYTVELPKWHPGSGNKAWLFMDEWIFN